jgi:Ser/Thr protein kinase RdoA (MazF antagonist)
MSCALNHHEFYQLTPETIMDAVESVGYYVDGRVLPLNSYENRVYQVGIDQSEPVIVKFYRPNRWSDEAILEEHAYLAELQEQAVSAVSPLSRPNKEGESTTLFRHESFRFALFPRRGGRAPELDNPDHLFHLGNTLGRIHLVGQAKPFEHRPSLNLASFGQNSIEYLLEHALPTQLKSEYRKITSALVDEMQRAYERAGDVVIQRVHGDCHPGNILWRDEKPHFVDFDDARMAPAIQDIWMWLSGDRHQQELQLAEIVDGYNEFASLNPREVNLIETFRTLRMMHYAAWLARRWEDPAFPVAFPWFNTEAYWAQHLNELNSQISALKEPLLRLL